MDQPALIDLSAVGKFSKIQVGEQVLQLSKLLKRGIPIPQTAVIPRLTLESIIHKTNLAQKLKQTLDSLPNNQEYQHNLIKQIKYTIRHLRLPTNIIKQISVWYQQSPDFLRISAVSDSNNQRHHDNVSGDANLIDSIMAVWAELIVVDFDKKKLEIYAPPILIQHQGQPEISGFALTQSPQQKSQLQIFSCWGVYDPHYPEVNPDLINVDIRTMQITQKQLYPQYLMLQRQIDSLKEKSVLHYKQQQLSLDDNQALELAHLIITIKKSIYGPHLINWYYQQGQFYITEIKPILVSSSAQNNKIILSGDSLQPGISSGSVFVLTNKKQLPEINFGQVLVIKELIADYLPVLTKAAAVICDHGLAIPMLAKHIKKHNLPTILNTIHATKYLKPGLSIIVDANAGLVLAMPTQTRTVKPNVLPLTITKVYISAGNPLKAAEYISPAVDGVGVLRSEYSFASLGEHPLHLLKSRKRTQLKEILIKTIQAYQKTKPNLPVIYRSQNFTSQEFRALTHAVSFEPTELNPYLGLRGGLKMISSFELLDLEMEVMNEVLTTSSAPLGFMLPFIRTSSELQLITNYLTTRYLVNQQTNLSLYLQLNTPENVLQLRHYLSKPISGISVNVRSLHALLHGIDPDNPDIYSLYPIDIELMRGLLEKVMHAVSSTENNEETIRIRPKAMLHLEDYNLQLIEIATRLGFDIITVKPEFASRAKQCIAQIEEQRLNAV
ncbi:hypothetical protein KJ707_02015 [Patescibacteria group bacterium]|nr:hypothetical protein [Patescibacteria group bacterium]